MKFKIFSLGLGILFLSRAASFAAVPTVAEKRENVETKTEEELAQVRSKEATAANTFLANLIQKEKLKIKARHRKISTKEQQKQEELRIKERHRKMLTKVKGSLGVSYGFEGNPNYTNPNRHIQSASFIEQDFSLSWIPTFNKYISADVSYNMVKQDYLTFGTLTSYDHSISTSVKYRPFGNRRLILEPGASYEWLIYPHSVSSDDTQLKGFFKFTYTPSKLWSYGGKYERAHKIYIKQYARSINQVDLRFDRVDYRDTVELWVKRNIGKYSVRFKERGYVNRSNDKFQNFYDYDDYTTSLTFSGSFLSKDKLFLTFTPSYERKNYLFRLANGNEERYDNIVSNRFDAFYSLTKNVTLNYSYTARRSTSNAPTGQYVDFIHQVGVLVNF